MHIRYIPVGFLIFSSCRTIFMFLCAQVTWRRVEHPIARLNRYRHLSGGLHDII